MLNPSRLLRAVQRLNCRYAGAFTPLLEETGLSMGEVHVLLFLANNPGYDTARDVTELRGIGKSQVSQAVELLADRGLLERRPDEGDRRMVHLAITAAGAPLAREAQRIQSACGAELLRGMTEPERRQFLRLLARVVDNVENEEGRHG